MDAQLHQMEGLYRDQRLEHPTLLAPRIPLGFGLPLKAIGFPFMGKIHIALLWQSDSPLPINGNRSPAFPSRPPTAISPCRHRLLIVTACHSSSLIAAPAHCRLLLIITHFCPCLRCWSHHRLLTIVPAHRHFLLHITTTMYLSLIVTCH